MLKKMFSTIIFLIAIFLVPISSSKALAGPDLSGLDYTNSNSYVIVWSSSRNTFVAYGSRQNAWNSNIATNNIVGSRFLNLSTNFYGLSSISTYVIGSSDNSYMGYIYIYDLNNNTWSLSCTQYSGCYRNYAISSSDYIYAFIPAHSNTFEYNYSYNSNSPLFYLGYNLKYYSPVTNSFSTYDSYLQQPTHAYGSSSDFTSDDITSSLLGFDKSYINTFMYSASSINDSKNLLGVRFNYDDFSSANYKELGFILTYIRESDIPPIVHAKTEAGTYSCTVSTISNDYTFSLNNTSYTYQWYVNCPSIETDTTLDIVVQGASFVPVLTGPFPIWDTNYLLQENAGYFGISSILVKDTSVIPSPLEPAPDNDISSLITDLNNNIMDSSGPDTSVLSQSAGWLPPGPVDSIINMPLSLFNGLLNIFSSNSMCQPITLPIPYLNSEYLQLPCFNTLISSMGFGAWFEGIGLIAGAYILYKYLINLYAWVDKTLTFRENNWQDWGGI